MIYTYQSVLHQRIELKKPVQCGVFVLQHMHYDMCSVNAKSLLDQSIKISQCVIVVFSWPSLNCLADS